MSKKMWIRDGLLYAKDDDGEAFNVELSDLDMTTTLRDQFAMAALTGIIAHGGTSGHNHSRWYGAEAAYRYADAMILQKAVIENESNQR